MKLTSPGVPDIYQGNELLQFDLVDPDNRRPVDYALRQKLLSQMKNEQSNHQSNGQSNQQSNEQSKVKNNDQSNRHSTQQASERTNNLHQSPYPSHAILSRVGALLANPGRGELKLYLIWKTLSLRKAAPSLFAQGSYSPLQVTGEKSGHVIAFTRQHENQTAIIVVPRLCFSLLADSVANSSEAGTSDANSADTVWSNSAGNSSAWGNTALDLTTLSHSRCYHNIFTGECLSLNSAADHQPSIAKLLARFPVALLLSQTPAS